MAITLIRRPGQFAAAGFTPLLITAAAVFMAVFLGLAVSVLPWSLTLALLSGLLVLFAAMFSPFAGIMIVMMLAFEIIPGSLQTRLPIFGGRLQMYDLLLMLLTAVVALRLLANKKPIRTTLGPMLFPLVYVYVCVAVSLVYVRLFAPNDSWLSEGRMHIMWLLLPLLALTVETPKRLKRLVMITCLMGLTIAFYVVLQSLLEIRIMTNARVERLDQGLNRDVIRSIAGGGVYLIVFTLFLTLNRAFDQRMKLWLAVPVGLILLAGLTVQYGRGLWLASFFGLGVSAFLHRGVYGLIRTTLWMMFIGGLLLSAALVLQPRLAEAVIDRAVGTVSEFQSGGSFNWRKVENGEALKKIEQRPFMGVGIGGDYKGTVSARGSFAIETVYIHNAYLYYPLKMGIHAALVPLAFIIAFGVVVWQFIRRWGWGADRGLLAAVVGSFTVPVITATTQAEWSSPSGIAALCLLMAIGLLMSRLGPWASAVEARKTGANGIMRRQFLRD